MIGVVFIAVVVLHVVDATFHESYIMNVSPTCGSTNADSSTITVRTDMDVSVSALCKGTSAQPFTKSQNDVVHTKTVLPATKSGSNECLFYKKQNSGVYTIKIEISYGEPGAFVHTQQQTYLITCTYDDNGINVAESASKTIEEAYIQPMELQGNMGSASSGTFALNLVDVMDNPITGNVAIGRKVRLHGALSAGTGVRAVSCFAYSDTSSFSILRGGCGDGVVFDKDEGFTTSGLDVYSPYFGAFKLSDGATIQVSCNFTECSSNCDGDSCTNVRRKRSSENQLYDGQPFETMTPPVNVGSKKCTELGEKKLGNGLIVMAPPETTKSDSDNINVFMMLMIGLVTIIMAIGCLSAVYVYMRRDQMSAVHKHMNSDL